MKTISIHTTQNVDIACELATLGDRIIAFIIDVLVVGLGYWIFSFAAISVFGGLLDGEWGWLIALFVAPFFVFFLYNMLMEMANAGQSVGKKIMNIRVVRLDGKEVEWGDVTLRAFFHLADTFFSFGVIASLLVRVTAYSQRLGDMAAATTVIRVVNTRYYFRLNDIVNIATTENYTPIYPQVKQLHEQDMLLIKKTLQRAEAEPNNQAVNHALIDLSDRLCQLLDIPQTPFDRAAFLRTLLKDYIVSTR